ncbi:hypothetical protein V5799_008713, partial [Amblyomma americanum]
MRKGQGFCAVIRLRVTDGVTSHVFFESIDPSIKRNLCKKCSVLLCPGITCTERLR